MIVGRRKSRAVAVQVLRLDVYDDFYVLYLHMHAPQGLLQVKVRRVWRVRCMPSLSYAGAKYVVSRCSITCGNNEVRDGALVTGRVVWWVGVWVLSWF